MPLLQAGPGVVRAFAVICAAAVRGVTTARRRMPAAHTARGRWVLERITGGFSPVRGRISNLTLNHGTTNNHGGHGHGRRHTVTSPSSFDSARRICPQPITTEVTDTDGGTRSRRLL